MWNGSFEKELTSQCYNQSMPESKDSPVKEIHPQRAYYPKHSIVQQEHTRNSTFKAMHVMFVKWLINASPL